MLPCWVERLTVDGRGGNDPAIVLDDVDIEEVAPKVGCTMSTLGRRR